MTRPPSPSRRLAPRTTDAALDELLEEGDVESLARALAPEPVEAAGRARLLAALESAHRFDDLEAEVAALLDVDRAEAARMLLDVDRDGAWEPGPSPSCLLLHVEGGARVRDAVTGFVRIEPGGDFPEHEHLGDEVVLVLQGAFRDGDRVVAAGEVARMPAGSAHALEADGDLPLLYLAVIQRGVVIGGTPLLAGDPRA